jgi:hypothetical protein
MPILHEYSTTSTRQFFKVSSGKMPFFSLARASQTARDLVGPNLYGGILTG